MFVDGAVEGVVVEPAFVVGVVAALGAAEGCGAEVVAAGGAFFGEFGAKGVVDVAGGEQVTDQAGREKDEWVGDEVEEDELVIAPEEIKIESAEDYETEGDDDDVRGFEPTRASLGV